MTIWAPELGNRSGPKYRAIAEALADDIAAGRLSPGDRLPTHRDLAWRLGVTVGTVSRAYALAQDRGLIAGEVGRGTLVRYPAAGARRAGIGDMASSQSTTYFQPPSGPQTVTGVIEMGRNYPNDPSAADTVADALQRMARPDLIGRLGAYHPPNGLPAHREAAAAWLAECGVEVQAESILIASGCQNALAIAMAGLCRPGDRVLMEALTWPGAAHLAGSLGLEVATVTLDEEGIRPDALDEACRRGGVRLLYTVPTLQNPTTATMSEQRRRDVVAIARKHGVVIVEDGVFSFLAPDSPPPIRTLAPDITVYATSVSKAVSPSLRIGYLAVPDAYASSLAMVVKATMLMPPTLGAQLVTELIHSGATTDAAARQRDIAADRQQMARQILGGHVGRTNPEASQVWLDLPARWSARQFAEEALNRGVSVNPASSFMPLPGGAVPANVRVCLATEADRGRIRDGLQIVAELLASHPATPAAIV